MRINDLADLSAPEAASALLTYHKGVQRNAEVDAWAFANQFKIDSPDARYFVDVAKLIVYGGEFPPVERKDPVFAVPKDMERKPDVLSEINWAAKETIGVEA